MKGTLPGQGSLGLHDLLQGYSILRASEDASERTKKNRFQIMQPHVPGVAVQNSISMLSRTPEMSDWHEADPRSNAEASSLTPCRFGQVANPQTISFSSGLGVTCWLICMLSKSLLWCSTAVDGCARVGEDGFPSHGRTCRLVALSATVWIGNATSFQKLKEALSALAKHTH